jgi:ABC-type dipeptide/oligopeptide/nickel transport system ATPase component/ABC-type dipeptide/oligopeptide/nickel transport system permease subunit
MNVSGGFWRRFARRRGSAIAGAYLLMWAFFSAFGQRLLGYNAVGLGDLRSLHGGPSWAHPLGTNEKGRDTLVQLIAGAQVDLRAAGVATVAGVVVGGVLGLALGFARALPDTISMRLVEAVQAVPGVILITTIITVVGPGLTGATVAIATVTAIAMLFTTRSEVRRQRDELYVASARVLGVAGRAIGVRHVLPNVLPVVLIVGATAFGGALLGLSGLALLGFGQPPPSPSWGTMLQIATKNMSRNWFVVVPPGLAIASVVFAVNTLVDGVRASLGRTPPTIRLRNNRSARDRLSIVPPQPLHGHSAERFSAEHRADDDVDEACRSTPSESSALVLAIEDLTVQLQPADGPPIVLVDGVSLSVRRGQIVAIVGESGSGKSMTVTAAVGVVPPGIESQARRVEVGGRSLHSIGSATKRRQWIGTKVGMVFQNPTGSLNPTQRVGPQVAATMRIHQRRSRADARRRVLVLFAQVGLEDGDRVVELFPHQLSGGMAQRVMIAAALSGEPDLIIADECTTALDVTVQSQVLELLRRIADDANVGVLFITHDLAVVAELADEVLVMHNGRIVERGSVVELFRAPQHEYTKALLSHANRRPVASPVVVDHRDSPGDSSSRSALEPADRAGERVAVQP